ncbi:hypothetical protein PS723_02425 [Pseudomonas fluorescens]|uniref:DUF7673 domain-containing protein n=1 Tax=Pseudomonas fluorescens TaxID=294 RepID=A0A5E7C0X5_PSEFL|nr:hypothetical protein PS723_02425 [Pseudomonas fluorescens]
MIDTLNANTRQALEGSLAVAQGDTKQSRRCANFLLAWWNAAENGGFDLSELCGGWVASWPVPAPWCSPGWRSTASTLTPWSMGGSSKRRPKLGGRRHERPGTPRAWYLALGFEIPTEFETFIAQSE